MSQVSPSRMYTHSIMSNSGFGDLTIQNPNGVVISIPQSQITQDGHIKKNILKHSQELTRENCEYLENKGIRLFVGKQV